MSLLREIQNDAVNANIKISDLLRKCKILAYRLGSEEFKSWIAKELNGYVVEKELPEYRIIEVKSKGNFIGPLGSSLTNVDIPSISIDKKHHKDMHTTFLYAPVSELETLVENSWKQEKNLRDVWNANFVAFYGDKIYRNYRCIQAWKEISPAQIQGAIDLIKTKILDFVLEIEMINEDAGDVEINSNPIPQDKVSQVFNIHIAGDVQNLASGNHQSTINQNISNKIPQDFLELLTKVKSSNLDDQIVTELEKRIESLGNSVGKEEYNENYKDLMSFASNHVTVLTFLATYIPMLAGYL